MPPEAAADSIEGAWPRFAARLRAFVARRMPAAEVDDLVQEVFLRLAEAPGRPERLEAWIFSVARRAIADHYRRAGRRPEAETLDRPLLDERPDTEAHEEVLSWLRPMAEELPEPYSEALVLSDFEGWTQAEVARHQGLSLPGAKSRIQRARARLAEALHRCCAVEVGAEGRVERWARRACEDC